MNKKQPIILNAHYDLETDTYIATVPETAEEIFYRLAYERLADSIRQSIHRDLYLQYAKDHPIYNLTST